MVPPVPRAGSYNWRSLLPGGRRESHYGPTTMAYLLSFLLISAAAAVSLSLSAGGSSYTPFIVYYPAIAAAGYFAGLGPALMAVVLGAIYAWAFFLYPPTLLNWFAFATISPLVSILFSRLRELRDRSRAIARDLENFKLIGDHVSDWILLLDTSLRIRYVNLKASTDLAWNHADLTGRNIESLVPEANRAELIAAVEAARSGAARPVEIPFTRSDQALVPMEVGCTAVSTAEGQIIHLAARDIRERKEIARKLEQIRHWESLRVLAGGLAHDFNNLLTGILGNASVARGMLPPDHKCGRMLDGIVKSAEQSAELVNLILAASGYRQPFRETVALDELLDCLLTARPLPAGIRLAKQVESCTFDCDRKALETLLWNLLVNAAEAYNDTEGDIHIAIRTCTASAATAVPGWLYFEEGDPGPGECVGISVEDHGSGMTPLVLERAFDPFFSTKFTGRGLGLAAVRGIVRAYSGKLFVATAVGLGTRVEVWLPKADKPA